MNITASISGFTDGETVYVKGAFFQAGSSNYFGYTKSGDIWIKNSAPNTSQRSVKIGEWDGTLSVKSDFSDSGYKGEGDYLVKLGFYTGSATSVNWSANSLAIVLNEPDPTSSPTQLPTASNTMTPVPTAKSTMSPTPTHIKASYTPTSTIVPTLESAASVAGVFDGRVLLPDFDNSHYASQESSSSGLFNMKPYIIASLFISLGFGMLCAVFLLKKKGILGV